VIAETILALERRLGKFMRGSFGRLPSRQSAAVGDAEPLRAALRQLGSERLANLVSRLDEPTIRIAVGQWYPDCPMILAGFNPYRSLVALTPEHVFAQAWDSFAAPARRPLGWGRLPRIADPEDVDALRRCASEELAERAAGRSQLHEPEGASGMPVAQQPFAT